MNNKPLSMIIEETKTKLATVCNESGLTPVILDLIMQGIYNEIHNFAEKQTENEKTIYAESLKKEIDNIEAVKEIDVAEDVKIVE